MAANGQKRRPKRARPGKQGAELREEKPKRRELDGGLPVLAPPDSGSAEILNSRAEAAQQEKQSNGSFQDQEQSDEDDIEDDYNVFSEDEAHDIVNNKNDGSDERETSCSFHRHVTHIITNEDVNALMKQTYRFKWEMPAEDIPKSKWVGTGDKMQGAYGDILGDVKGKLRDHWQITLSDHLNSRLKFFSLSQASNDNITKWP